MSNPTGITRENLIKRYNAKFLIIEKETEDVRNFLANADCIVLPSSYKEGTPKSLIEAAAIGMPIITTDNVGCTNVVKHNHNGFICKKYDPSDLALKMEMMINLSNEKYKEFCINSRNLAEKFFDVSIVVNDYYKKIICFDNKNS